MTTRILWSFFLPFYGLAISHFKFNSTTDGYSIKNSDIHAQSIPNEDSFYTVPLGFVITDGVGSDLLPGDIFSRSLSLYLARLFMSPGEMRRKLDKTNYAVNFEENVLKYSRWSIANFNDKLGRIGLPSPGVKLDNQSKFDRLHLTTNAATVLAVFINNDFKTSNSIKSLRIFQKGDSLVMVFNPVTIAEGKFGISFFSPEFVLKEQVHAFRVPHQFISTDPNFSQHICHEYIVKNGTIVVAGTDGLFDNLPLSFITYLVNLLAFETAINNISEEMMEGLVRAKVNLYISKMKDENTVLKMYEKIREKAKVHDNTFFWLLDGIRNGLKYLLEQDDSTNPKSHAYKNQQLSLDSYIAKQLLRNIPEIKNNSTKSNREYDNFAKKLNARNADSFFDCSLEDIFYEPKDYSKAREIISGCTESSIMSAFPFSELMIKRLIKNFNSMLVSKGIALAAQIIAETKTKNLIPYNLREFEDAMEKLNLDAKPSSDGRLDDITVVAAIVKNGDSKILQSSDEETFEEQFKELIEKSATNFEQEIENEFIDLEEQIEKRRMQVIKKLHRNEASVLTLNESLLITDALLKDKLLDSTFGEPLI